jgi:hypothetical protein
MNANIRTARGLTPDLTIHIEAVHRLNNLAALITATGHGTSQDGFVDEYRMVQLLTVEPGRITRCELFDEGAIEAAIAQFEELHPQTPRLQNAASQLDERFKAAFAARDWAALADTMADDMSTDDRRRVIGAGVRRGRGANIADLEAIAAIGAERMTTTVIATRGERLVLVGAQFAVHDEDAQAFNTEMLRLLEINPGAKTLACIMFDPKDIGAAFAELDARYLVGEAAVHAHTWSR